MNFKTQTNDWSILAKHKLEERFKDMPNVQEASSLPSRTSSKTSKSSTSSSARAREMMKIAELKAKAKMLDKRQALENEFERLRLQEEIAIAEAREEVLAQSMNELDPEVTIYGGNELSRRIPLDKGKPDFV